MNPDEDKEYIYVTYMYPVRCKWKTKIKCIKSELLDEYKRLYRVVGVSDYDVREDYKRG